MSDVTPERQRAGEIQRHYSAATQQLRADKDLTDEARSRRLAETWTRARRELDELQAAERQRLSKRQDELQRRLFGGSGGLEGAAHAISSRDAQDRAARLTTPQEAVELLYRAEQNGDQTLARAVAQHAARQSDQALTRQAGQAWTDVLASFVDARPNMTPVVEELAMIERLGKREVFGPFSLAQPQGVLSADINAAAAQVPA